MKKIKKGQVRLILELFLFALGIMIAIFASTFFKNFSEWISVTTEEDQLEAAAYLISSSFLKVHELNANATLSLDLLPYVNDKSYIIEAFDNQLLLYDIYNYSIRSSMGLFYISEDKNIYGSASSSTGKIFLRAWESAIEILR